MYTHGVFVVHGVSGCGKSTLLRLMTHCFENLTVHVQDSNRKPRTTDEDIRAGVPETHFREHRNEYVAVYEKYNNLYGIRRDQWNTAYEERQLHFVICCDINAIRQLKVQYRVTALHVHTDSRDVERLLRRRAAVDELERKEGTSIKERLRRMKLLNKEYIENNTLFDYTILNFVHTSAEQDAAMRQLQNIINDHRAEASRYLKK